MNSSTWTELSLENPGLERTAVIFHCDSCCTCQTAPFMSRIMKGCYFLGKHMLSAYVEIILCLLFPVTVVRFSMKHKEEKGVTSNKIQQAKKDLTYHGTYGWLFENKKRRVSKCFACENLKIVGPAFAWRGVTGCGCLFNASNERVNKSMDGMDGADLVVCSLMDFGIWTFLFSI